MENKKTLEDALASLESRGMEIIYQNFNGKDVIRAVKGLANYCIMDGKAFYTDPCNSERWNNIEDFIKYVIR